MQIQRRAEAIGSRRTAECLGTCRTAEPQCKRNAGRRARSTCIALVCASLIVSGCGTPAPLQRRPPELTLPSTIAVEPSSQTPKVVLPGVPGGRVEGAARGAGITAAQCLPQALASAGTCTATGPFAGICAAVPVLLVAVCGVISAGGAAYGAVKADSAEHSARNLKLLEGALADRARLQEMLANSVTARTQQMTGLQWTAASRDATYRIETQLLELGLGGGGALLNEPIELRLVAAARLVRSADAQVLHEGRYRIALGERTLVDWMGDGGADLQRLLLDAYLRLGEHIAEQLLLLTPLPGEAVGSAGALAVAFGLAPESPRFTASMATSTRWIGSLAGEWPEVGVQPELRWQSFPRPEHLAADATLAQRLGGIRYDLVIAPAEGTGALPPVYRSDGLSEPHHRVETALVSGRRYYWSVRAHFMLDGRERVSEWGTTNWSARVEQAVPNRFSYRFQVK